jgi:hypothetical protein
MHTKKSLGFTALIKGISKLVSNLADPRENYRIKYSVHDTILSGLACMFTQCPSLSSKLTTLLQPAPPRT